MFIQNEKRGTTLYCFSPPVVLATFLIEIVLAIYAWWRYRSTRFGRIAAVFLVLLAGFQGSEFMICLGNSAIIWSKIGYICTAFMPILGLDFINEIRKKRTSLAWGYGLATAFSVIIAIVPGIFQDAACTGTYVAFQTQSPAFDLAYALYYMATMFAGVFLLIESKKEKGANVKAMNWLLVGYATDIIPTTTVYLLTTTGNAAVASVLCGFAVLLALIVVFKLLPLVHPKQGK